MCDIEKRGAVSFPVSSLYPIRSEKKGALSLAKGYRAFRSRWTIRLPRTRSISACRNIQDQTLGEIERFRPARRFAPVQGRVDELRLF
jgi:hypothetical protein